MLEKLVIYAISRYLKKARNINCTLQIYGTLDASKCTKSVIM